MIDRVKASGKFEISINGKLVETIENKLMNAVLEAYSRSLLGTAPDIEIAYLALGTGSTAPTNTDTQLQTEVFRTPIVSLAETSTGVIESLFIVLSAEAVAVVEEIGIFGGTTAGAGANSGTLLARVLWHHDKTASEEIQFKRTDTVRRA